MIAPVAWITGRPAAGKTELGAKLVAELDARGVQATLIDSDEVRAVVTPDPRYDPRERELVYRAIAYAAARLAEEGVLVVVAATAHTAALRSIARSICPSLQLLHARCSPEVCERRDPKGLYRRARASPGGTLPGVGEAFEDPTDADLTVDTEQPIAAGEIARVAGAILQKRR